MRRITSSVIDKRVEQVTTTVYLACVPHSGCIIAKEIAQCFSDIPESAVLCGFSDDADSVKFSFRHKHVVDVAGAGQDSGAVQDRQKQE